MLRATASGRLQPVTGSPFATGRDQASSALALADFNADGKLDAAVANFESRTCRCCSAMAAGVLGPPSEVPVPHRGPPVAIVVAATSTATAGLT